MKLGDKMKAVDLDKVGWSEIQTEQLTYQVCDWVRHLSLQAQFEIFNSLELSRSTEIGADESVLHAICEDLLEKLMNGSIPTVEGDHDLPETT